MGEDASLLQDTRLLQDAYSALGRLGRYPSRAALREADSLWTRCLARWESRGGSAPPDEVGAILRFRASVRRRAGDVESALADLDRALALLPAPGSRAADRSEELPRTLVARADTLASMGHWRAAVDDYDAAAELLGEPVEDTVLLAGRGSAKQRLGLTQAAVDDLRSAAGAHRRFGRRAEAEVQEERAGVAALALPGNEGRDLAEEALSGVIRRSVGLQSEDVASLQEVVIAAIDARAALAALWWSRGDAERAETYWLSACSRLDKLVEDVTDKKQLAMGFPNSKTYRCDRYELDDAWLRSERVWPEVAIGWLRGFLRNRPSQPPRASWQNDVAVGKRPGDDAAPAELYALYSQFGVSER